MKILLMGDASNYHRCLGNALSRAGHDVTVASNGSGWMDTARDIDLSRSRGKVGGALLYARLRTVLASRLKGYDVVQLANPIFLDLRPGRVRDVFNRLRRDNGGVYLTAMATDTPYVDMCFSADCPLHYSEFRANGRPTPYALDNRRVIEQWQSPLLADFCRHVYDNIDGAVSALYEYHLSCSRLLPPDKLAYAGIPVDIPSVATIAEPSAPLRVMVACHKSREREKGADIILPAVKAAVERSGRAIAMDLVQNVPLSVFARTLDRAHVVVDQLYSYTPATTALMAMARGKIAISGAEEEYYGFIGEKDLRPIVNADPACPEAITDRLLELAANPAQMARMAADSRSFAQKHNSADVVARRFIDFWERTAR